MRDHNVKNHDIYTSNEAQHERNIKEVWSVWYKKQKHDFKNRSDRESKEKARDAPLQSVLLRRFALETDAFAQHHNLTKHGGLFGGPNGSESSQTSEAVQCMFGEKTQVFTSIALKRLVKGSPDARPELLSPSFVDET